MNGFINLLKPCGMSSSDAVFRVKRATHCKNCGHMGTLDPGAAGVLPVAVGKAARLFDYLLDKRKRYRAVFRFGLSTDTLDSYGKVEISGGRVPAAEEIAAVLPEMCGAVLQTAPLFSAKKINGKKGYELARAGREYEPPKKCVAIYDIKLLGRAGENAYEFDIECGGGTYIRSIARDLAQKLGTVAFMRSLIRLQSGCFRIEDAVTPEELDEFAAAECIPMISADFAVADFPCAVVPDEWAFRFGNGVPVPVGVLKFELAEAQGTALRRAGNCEGGVCRVRCGGEFWGMGEMTEGEDGISVLRLKSKVLEARCD